MAGPKAKSQGEKALQQEVERLTAQVPATADSVSWRDELLIANRKKSTAKLLLLGPSKAACITSVIGYTDLISSL